MPVQVAHQASHQPPPQPVLRAYRPTECPDNHLVRASLVANVSGMGSSGGLKVGAEREGVRDRVLQECRPSAHRAALTDLYPTLAASRKGRR